MRTFAFAVLMAAATAVSSIQAAESRPPNVVFIMVDDLGWSDVGFNGSKVYETPNVDRLAAQGMVLSDFYSGGPVCSPTRASIMTGKYTARTGITTYLLSPTRDAKHVQPHLPLEELTIAEAFKKNGFSTGYFGKWHLGYENEFWAGNQGFDVAKGGIDLPWAWTLCYPGIGEAPTVDTWPKTHTRFFSPYHLTHLDNGPANEYLTERLTNETIEFIEQHAEQPFFAFLSFHTVHTPLQAKPEKIEKYRKKIAALGLDSKKETNRREKAFQNNAAYAAMVEHMDENVGRLLARLHELKLSDNTIVVWTSDNGGKGSVTSNLPLRGMKHNLYEGGIRVPTIVRWPEQITAGTTSATPLISNDFYPTLLELAGLPVEPQQHLDGISFSRILLGKSERVGRDAIYWHYPHGRQEAAVRRGRYKLLHRFEKNSVELYDLRADIGERTDLSKVKPEISQRMLAMLKRWQQDVGAKFEGDDRPAATESPSQRKDD
jgi:arylsulfatase A-like enzyme